MTREERDELRRIYAQADEAIGAWAGNTGLACPDGCGLCSKTHDPACLPIEAELIAEYLFDEQPDLLQVVSSGDPGGHGPCVFHRDDSPFHCSIYPVRPLLCRLFGFTGSRASDGAVRFALCRHMPAPAQWERRRSYAFDLIANESAPDVGPEAPPLVDSFRRPLGAVRPDDEGDEDRLSIQIRRAVARVGLARRLAAGRADPDHPDDDRPTPSRPTPIRPAA